MVWLIESSSVFRDSKINLSLVITWVFRLLLDFFLFETKNVYPFNLFYSPASEAGYK